MLKYYKKEICKAGIFLASLAAIFYILNYTKFGLSGQANETSADRSLKKAQIVEIDAIDSVLNNKIIQFANQIAEQYTIENVATIIVETKTLDSDGYDKYLVEVSAVGVNKLNETSLYSYYIVLKNTDKEKLSVMPQGIQILKDNHNEIKRDIMISMTKALNDWGNDI